MDTMNCVCLNEWYFKTTAGVIPLMQCLEHKNTSNICVYCFTHIQEMRLYLTELWCSDKIWISCVDKRHITYLELKL